MYSYIKEFTEELFKKYSDRKHTGVLALIFDCKKRKYLPVPRNMEHFALLVQLISEEEIKNNTLKAANFVPVTLTFVPGTNEIKGVIIALSGLEMGYKITHTKEQLDLVHVITLDTIGKAVRKGILQLHKDFQCHVNYKWLRK